MSADIVITLVGAALLVVVVLDAALSLGLMKAQLRVVIGSLGVVLMIYGGYSFGAVVQLSPMEQVDVGNKRPIEYPVQKVQVVSPIAGDVVKCRMLTMGVYPDGHDKDIWVVLRPTDDRYYPQSDHTNTTYKRDGEWQVITRFGGDKDEEYDLIVYETDGAASRFFSETIEEWKKDDFYPGLELDEVPKTAVEVDRLVVSLQDNCRGVF
ncbi:MAG: hypothetical protein AAGD10_20365 [Myxococcota bacterium]